MEGFAPLTVASYFGHKDVVAILLKANATPDIQEKDGLTALIIATQEGHRDIVSLLLEGGANPNIAEKDSGWSALFFAAETGKKELAKLLLDGGADPRLQDQNGVTPFSLAKLHHHQDVCDLLENFYNSQEEGVLPVPKLFCKADAP